jgi:hypothetical protein
MTTAPAINKTDADRDEILRDPKVRAALAELRDPEDREDLIDALIAEKRIKEGKEKTHSLKEAESKLGFPDV